jgi:hypothetical protein
VVHERFVAMGRSAGVAQTHEVAEGKTHIADGVASSEVSGSRRTTSSLVGLQRSEVS